MAATLAQRPMDVLDASIASGGSPRRARALKAALTALLAIAQRQSGRDASAAYTSFAQAASEFTELTNGDAWSVAPFLSDYLAMLADFGEIDNSFIVAQRFNRTPLENVAYEPDASVFLWLLAAAIIPTPRSVLALGLLLHKRTDPAGAFEALLHSAAFGIASYDETIAAEAVDSALSIYPLDSDARSLRGFVRLWSGKAQSASDDFSVAVQADALDVEAHLAFANASLQAGDLESASRALAIVLSNDSDNLDALFVRGELHRLSGDSEMAKGETITARQRWEAAIADLSRVIADRSISSVVFRSRGIVNCRLGELEHALEDLDQAIQQDPGDVVGNGWRAAVLLLLDRDAEALAAVNVALALLGSNLASAETRAWLLSLKGEALIGTNWLDVAIETLNQAVALEGNNIEHATRLIQAYRNKRDWQGLAREARNLENNGYDAEFLLTLRLEEVGAHCNSDDYEAALAALTREPRLPAGHPSVQWRHARILADIGDFESAHKLLLEKMPGQETEVDFLGILGWIVQNLEPRDAAERAALGTEGLGLYSAALTLLEQTESKQEDAVWLKKGLANATLRSGESAAAERAYVEVIEECEKWDESADQNVRILALIGWCQYAIGKYGLAMHYYESAFDKGDQAISVAFDHALVLAASPGGEVHGFEKYREVTRRAAEVSQLRWVGLCRVALHDLKEFVYRQPDMPEAPRIAHMLSIELAEAVSKIAANNPVLAEHVYSFLDTVKRAPLDMSASECEALNHRINAARRAERGDGTTAISELEQAARVYAASGETEWESKTWADAVRLYDKFGNVGGSSRAVRNALRSGLYQYDRESAMEFLQLATRQAILGLCSSEEYTLEIRSTFAAVGAERAYLDASKIVDGMSDQDRELFLTTVLRVFKIRSWKGPLVYLATGAADARVPGADSVMGPFIPYLDRIDREEKTIDARSEVGDLIGVAV